MLGMSGTSPTPISTDSSGFVYPALSSAWDRRFSSGFNTGNGALRDSCLLIEYPVYSRSLAYADNIYAGR